MSILSDVKQIIKYLLYFIIDILFIKKRKVKYRTILILKTDGIGDYILFRNFLKYIIENKKYKNYEIILVGNIIWKDIALFLDTKYIAKSIWIERAKFAKVPMYRYKKLREITKTGYEVVINPTYSRSFFVDDSIVKVVSAKEKIGNIGDLSNIKKWQKKISDTFYTMLFPAENGVVFEFYRNKKFFENLLGMKINIKKPFINLPHKDLDFSLPKNYAVLFIGASANFRKWSIKRFVEVGKYLKNTYGYEIILCGGPSDLDDAKKFENLADYVYIDLVGKTSLIDFMYVIYNGNLIVTNETFTAHLAVALEIKNIFVISNGNHFGRFIPYPKKLWEEYYPIYHPEIAKNLDDYKKLSNSYCFGSDLDINEISSKKVIKIIDRIL